MNHLAAFVVRSGMARKRRQIMWAWEPAISLALVGALSAGCASKSDVLTERGALGSETNPWTACGTDLTAFFAQAKIGDKCSFGGGCGHGVTPPYTQGENRTCENGELFGLTMQDLSSTPASDAGSAHPDCLAALDGIENGGSCGWTGACARLSQEPCCVEYAACGPFLPGVVHRAHICAPGCENVAPVTSLPVATGCPTELPSNIGNGGLGRPCEGDFVCVSGAGGPTEGAGSNPGGMQDDLTWCENGVVIGGTLMPWYAEPA
jgi:hypothetical protein